MEGQIERHLDRVEDGENQELDVDWGLKRKNPSVIEPAEFAPFLRNPIRFRADVSSYGVHDAYTAEQLETERFRL